jgi:dipeptidyl aminopeptidase/acylaminoacyl peptidase
VWSPNGEFLAFLSDRDGSGQATVWLWEVKKNELRRLQGTALRADNLQWSPDSRKLLVSSRADNSPNSEERSIPPLCTSDSPKSEACVGIESTAIVYESESNGADSKRQTASVPWSLDEYMRDLLFVDIATGERKVILRNHRIARYVLSPDGSRIAYTTPTRFEKPGSQQTLFNLVSIDLTTKLESILATDVRLSYDGGSFSWSPRGDQLSLRTNGQEEKQFNCFTVDVVKGGMRKVSNFDGGAVSQFHRSTPALWDAQEQFIYFIHEGTLWRSSVNQGKAEQVAAVADRKITWLVPRSDNVLWTQDDGQSTVVIAHDIEKKRDGFYRVDLPSGKTTKLLEDTECYTCAFQERFAVVTTNGQFVAHFAENAGHDSNLWLEDSGFTLHRQLTDINPQFDKYKLGAAGLIDWLNLDGVKLQGALLLPAGYTEGKRYPLVVWVYGGLYLSEDLNKFGLVDEGPLNMQLLATRGYAVLLADAPLHAGTPLLDLAKDVLPGVNKVIEMGIADPDRLGVIGRSYGGYCTLSLLVQTKRFKAAVDIDGFGDLTGAYGQMDLEGGSFLAVIAEQGRGSMAGTPWEYGARYIENSPITYLDRVETPVLIIHGTEDVTVAPFLGDQVFVGLRRLNKKAEYAKYTGEDHSPPYWSYKNQLDLSKRLIRWFDEHLKAQ